MAIQGRPRSFYSKFKFRVEIDGFVYAGFQSCSELKATAAVVEHYEGGAVIPTKSPGRVNFDNLTLSRGATQDQDMWDWFQQVADLAAGGVGEVGEDYKRTFDIVQVDRDDTEVQRYRVVKAWPVSFSAGDWDNTSDDNRIVSVELAHEGFTLVQ